MPTRSISFINGRWIETPTRQDVSFIFTAFVALVFSIALISAVMHRPDTLDLPGEALIFSGP